MLVMLEICLKALSRCRDSCRKCPALYINHSLKRPCQSVDVSGYFQSYYSNFQSDSTNMKAACVSKTMFAPSISYPMVQYITETILFLGKNHLVQ